MSHDTEDVGVVWRNAVQKTQEEDKMQFGEMTPEEAVGQILPSQELMNNRAHVNHPAQYKKVGQSGPRLSIPGLKDDAPWEATRAIVTVKNVATSKIVDLDLRTEIGQRAWRDIRFCTLARTKAKQALSKVGR